MAEPKTKTILLAGGDIYAIEITGNNMAVYDKKRRDPLIQVLLSDNEKQQIADALTTEPQEGTAHGRRPEASSSR